MSDTAYSSLFPATLERRAALGRAHEVLELLYHTRQMPEEGPDSLRLAAKRLRPERTQMEDRSALMLSAQATFQSERVEDLYTDLEQLAADLEAIAEETEPSQTLRKVADQIAALRKRVIASRSEPGDTAVMT